MCSSGRFQTDASATADHNNGLATQRRFVILGGMLILFLHHSPIVQRQSSVVVLRQPLQAIDSAHRNAVETNDAEDSASGRNYCTATEICTASEERIVQRDRDADGESMAHHKVGTSETPKNTYETYFAELKL